MKRLKKIDKIGKNYGIEILRVILSFMIVLDRFYSRKRKKKLAYILYYNIPTLFLLSFYQEYNIFASFDIYKIKLRFERLAIPYFCWSIIAFAKNNIYHFIFKRKSKYTIKVFLHSLLNGHMLIGSLWIKNILILTTLIISIVIFSFQKEYLLIFQIFMILSYKFQYSGENYKFFKKNTTLHYRLTYGRFLETFPHSLSGFFIAAFRIPTKLGLYKLRTIFFSIIILIIISKYYFFKELYGFKYGGIRRNIAAVLIFILFVLPLEHFEKSKTNKLLEIITNYTQGIYFLHDIVGTGFNIKFILGTFNN